MLPVPTDLAGTLRLFHYNAWANTRLAAALDDRQERVLAIAAHLFTAERLWLMRLRGESTNGASIWPTLSAQACLNLAARNTKAIESYLDTLDAQGFKKKVRYRNSKGEAYATAIGDVLTHVLLHSAYHRGQTAAALREARAEPPVTDFIAYVRDGH